MKLPMPTSQEIAQMAERAEVGVYMCDGNRTATKLIIENAIRNALQIVTDRLDIQVPGVLQVNLGKS